MIAIIPARGGSKGLPGKNIKKLFGKPLIAYTIEAALRSEQIEEVFVSTDDPDIASIAEDYGAKCPGLRPAGLARDDSRAIDTYLYTVELLNQSNNYTIDEFAVLQPTSPLRTADDIDKTIDLFYFNNADSAATFTKESHPIAWHKRLEPDGRIRPIDNVDQLLNRQDIPATYYPNGAVLILKYMLLKKINSYYTDRSFAYLMPYDRSVDIDTIDDFNYAEYLMGKIHEK